ncbi:MAG: acyltransferase [Gammaproteobacteria bacterium]
MSNYIVYPKTQLITEKLVEDYVIIGKPLNSNNQIETLIKENAIIRSHSVIYEGNNIGKNFQTGHHVTIREYNNIGDNVVIGTSVTVEHHTKIGNNVRIHSGAFIPEYTIIEDDCFIAPNVTLTNSKYPRSPNAKKELKGPIIRKGAIIGANATILPGIEIGEYAIIGAGSVVSKDVTAHTVVAGCPAHVINERANLPYEDIEML